MIDFDILCIHMVIVLYYKQYWTQYYMVSDYTVQLILFLIYICIFCLFSLKYTLFFSFSFNLDILQTSLSIRSCNQNLRCKLFRTLIPNVLVFAFFFCISNVRNSVTRNFSFSHHCWCFPRSREKFLIENIIQVLSFVSRAHLVG